MPYLSSLFIYPIKSLAGIQLKQSLVTETGFQYDRKWMLVDEHQQFLSQRRHPNMALIKTRITDQVLHLSAPKMSPLSFPLISSETTPLVQITVWNDHCLSQTVSEECNQWFSHFLKIKCQLVYQPDNTIRTVDSQYSQPQDQTSFSDGFPFLITSEASLTLLNTQMNLSLSMRRFRPNLVVSDCASYAEDSWRKISIGSIAFRLSKPCSRCPMTQINPNTAIRDREPLRTLARTRKWNNQVYFGQNALHDNQGILHVGDHLVIHQSGPPQPPT